MPNKLPPDVNLLFVSKYCGPCHEVKEIVKDLDIKIIDIHNFWWERSIAYQYNVISVPTFIVIRNNKEIVRRTGCLTKEEYQALIKKPCLQKVSFTGVLYFTNNKVIHNTITKGILKRIKRFNVKICDPQGELAQEYEVTKLPTFIFIQEDKEIGRYIGIIPI